MEESTMEKCAHCGEEFNSDNGGTTDKNGEPICESCESNAWNYSNVVTVAKGGEVTEYIWCSEFGFRTREYLEEVNGGHPDGVIDWKYKQTDGWRGYHYPELEEGWITIMDGWTTGNWDDVPWKHKFNDFAGKIFSGEVECPFTVVIASGLTSNVFSTTADVIVKESDAEAFTEWVNAEMGYSIEDLKRALT